MINCRPSPRKGRRDPPETVFSVRMDYGTGIFGMAGIRMNREIPQIPSTVKKQLYV